MHHNTKGSKLLHKLREEPRVDIEHPSPSNGGLRNLISKIHVESGGVGDYKKWKGKTSHRRKTVYYLYGDERRAIRRFIKENAEFVEDCLRVGNNNPFAQQWDESMYQLLREEYEIMEYNNELWTE